MDKNRKILWQIIALVAVVIIIFLGIRYYEKGYRFSLRTFISSPGSAVIAHFDPSFQIFVDGNEKKGSPDASGSVAISVSSGSHEIVINRTGYYPWEKNIQVDSKQEVHLYPFAVPASTNGAVLPKTDAQFKAAENAIAKTSIPTKEKPITSSDGLIQAYLEDGALVAKIQDGATPPEYFCNPECAQEIKMLSLDAEVRGVDFMPGRNDVLLVAVQNRVFAIEIDTRGTQNFQPVYDGINPTFGVSGDALYIADGESIFTVQLTPAQ